MENEIKFDVNSQIVVNEVVIQDIKINPNNLIENIVNTHLNNNTIPIVPIDKMTINDISDNLNKIDNTIKVEFEEIKEDNQISTIPIPIENITISQISENLNKFDNKIKVEFEEIKEDNLISTIPLDKITINQISENLNQGDHNLKVELKEIKKDQNLANEINNILQEDDPEDIANKMTKKLINNKLKRNRDISRRNQFYRILNEEYKFSYRKGKYRPDCLRKKIKTNHFNFLNYLVSKCLNREFYSIYDKSIRDEIRIKQNKEIYSQTIKEFFENNSYIFKNSNINYKIDLFKHEIFSHILNLNLFEFLELYYYNENCIFHNDHLEKLKQEYASDLTYYHLYLIHDLDYLNYFLYEGGNQKTRKDINLKKPRIKNQENNLLLIFK